MRFDVGALRQVDGFSRRKSVSPEARSRRATPRVRSISMRLGCEAPSENPGLNDHVRPTLANQDWGSCT